MGENYKRRAIESEMDRFEKEISSLAGAPTTSFIPAQLRRPAPPPAAPGTIAINSSAVISSPTTVVRPSSVIISGAPQVYSAAPKGFKPAVLTTVTTSTKSTLGGQASTGADTASVSNLTVPKIVFAGSSGSLNAPNSPTSSSTLNASSSQPASVNSVPKPSTSSAADALEKKKKKKKKKQEGQDKKPKKALRSAGGQIWEDPTLQDWDPSGFRLFCGDLGNDVTDEVLTRVFGRYPSFQKAKVVRDKRSNKTKGFGFVSFKDPNDFVRAIKELDGRYVGSRPIKLRKSNWQNRNLDQARKKDKERSQILAQIKK